MPGALGRGFAGRWGCLHEGAGRRSPPMRGVEVSRCEDLVEIYASVCFEVDQTRADFYIARGASILPGPGCCLIIREPSPLVEGTKKNPPTPRYEGSQGVLCG